MSGSGGFFNVLEKIDTAGLVQVAYTFEDAPENSKLTTYTFQWQENQWIIADVDISSYRPWPKGKLEPRYIDETQYTGEQLEWVKLMNKDTKAIAEGDKATFDSLRQSSQSLPANLPSTPVVSLELLEVVEQSANQVKVQVDRRKWGNEDEVTIMNYVLRYENEKWFIVDLD